MSTAQLLSKAKDQLPRFSNEPRWFTEYRLRALEIYNSLAPETNPLYTKYAYLSRFEDTGLSLVEQKESVDAVPAKFSEFASRGAFFEDAHARYAPGLPEGVRVIPIEQALNSQADTVRKMLPEPKDKFEALNAALATGGYFIDVERSQEGPIHFMYVDDEAGSAQFRLNLVHLHANVSASVLEEKVSTSLDKGRSLFSETHRVALDEASSLYYSSFEYFAPSVIYLTNRETRTGKDSSIHWIYSYIGAAQTRARGDVVFAGQGSTADDYEVIFGNGTQKFDLVTDLHHNVQDTSGRVTVRSVLRDKSMALLRGMIRIAEGGKNTSAYLAEHGMLMSGEARCEAIPGLEILTNGVKATHSASVSQLDEEQLYYLQSRGLPREEAEKLMVVGFFEPMISRIPMDSVREKIRFQIEDKWNNELSLKSERHLDEIEFDRYVRDQIKTTSNIFEGHYKYR